MGENKELKKARQQRYRNSHKEQIAQYRKKYREANKEKIAERSKQYQQNNKEKIAQYKKQYREANIDDIKAKDKQRDNERAQAHGRAQAIRRLKAGLNVKDTTLHKYNIDKTEFQKNKIYK